jgi:hypothetical protein
MECLDTIDQMWECDAMSSLQDDSSHAADPKEEVIGTSTQCQPRDAIHFAAKIEI